MKIIRPTVITDAMLTSSTVNEPDATEPSAWASGTSYATGDEAYIGAPTATVTISQASPAVVTWTSNILGVGTPVVFTTSGTLPNGLTAGLTYFVHTILTANTFTVSATRTGRQIVTTSAGSGTHTAIARVHKVYEALGSSTGVSPLVNTGSVWAESRPTNRWAMFDQQVGTSTTADESLTVVLTPGRFNAIALLGLDAGDVSIELEVDGDTVYSKSMDLAVGTMVGDWYQYFYEPVVQTDTVVETDLVDATLLDLPAYADGILTITVTRTGGAVAVGALVVGMYADLGTTLERPEISIIDYSRKTTDDFGNTTVTERAYSKRMSAQVLVERGAEDTIARILAAYRATPVVWVGADDSYTSLIVYGFVKDWSIPIINNASVLSLKVEGLT